MLLIGFDGSPAAAAAIDIAARLLPGQPARIAHVWAPPFASRELREALRRRVTGLDELPELLEKEGEAEAERVAAAGIALAAAAGMEAAPIAHRSFGDEGFELARLAERQDARTLVVGSRGLTGARAVLGSASDAAVHFSPVPVLVVPHPLLSAQRRAALTGPVVVGVDGSEGAGRALTRAASLFAERELIAANVADGAEAGEAAPAATAVTLDPAGAPGSARAVAGALVAHAAEVDAALIAVGSRGRSAHREILLGSVAMAVLHHRTSPSSSSPRPSDLRVADARAGRWL